MQLSLEVYNIGDRNREKSSEVLLIKLSFGDWFLCTLFWRCLVINSLLSYFIFSGFKEDNPSLASKFILLFADYMLCFRYRCFIPSLLSTLGCFLVLSWTSIDLLMDSSLSLSSAWLWGCCFRLLEWGFSWMVTKLGVRLLSWGSLMLRLLQVKGDNNFGFRVLKGGYRVVSNFGILLTSGISVCGN